MNQERWELPESWEWVSAGEIAQIVGGGTPPSKDPTNFSTNGIPWLTPADLTGYKETYISKGARDLSEAGYRKCGAQLMPPGTVLFSSRAPVGYCAIAENEICTNQGFKSFILPDGLVPEYLHFYLLSSKEYLESLASGTTFKELSGSRASGVRVPIAPTNEQLRIVDKLDSLFERTGRASDELSHIPLLIEHYKQAILAAAFRGDLTADWRKSNNPAPVAKDPSGIDSRSSPLPSLPSGWTWTSVGNVTQVSGGLTKNARRREISTKVPYLRVANVYANELRLDDIQEIGCTPAEFEKTKLRGGDLLVVEGNGSLDQIGRVALWDDSVHGCSHQNHLIRVRARSDVTPDFLLFWMLSPVGRKYIERVASSSSGLHTLSISKISGLALPFCTIEEMAEITRRIHNYFGHIAELVGDYGRAADLLDRLDESYLAKAFRGELVAQDPADEPASVLLGRIRAEHDAKPKPKRRRKTASA